MSYNIDRWYQIRLEKLVLPMIFDEDDIQWHKNNRVEISLSDRVNIEGRIVGDTVHVSSISLTGEGSGYVYGRLIETLKQSTGILDAVLIWERGDSISRIVCIQGEVSQPDIDLVDIVRKSDLVGGAVTENRNQ